MTNPKFFMSDAHIGSRSIKNPKKQVQIVCDFMAHVANKRGDLVIIGDLFDFWFEYKYVIPREHHEILTQLQWFRQQGRQIYYVAGNHDFALDGFLTEDLGVHVYPNQLEMEIEGKRFFIFHGDGIVKKDIGYRIIKQIFRHPFSKFLFRLLHPDLGFALAHTLSGLSRDHRPVKNRDDEYIEAARNQFERGFDYVIMGHTHRPLKHSERDKTYINTGDWIENFTYALYEKGKIKLEKWT